MSEKANEILNDAGRFEFKYRLPRLQYYQVRNAIVPFMKHDHFTSITAGRRYFVRSLYYDTGDYQAYAEKIGGDCDRVKFRLRSYTDAPDDETPIRVEMKVRRGESLAKHSVFVSVPDYDYFIRRKSWRQNENPVLMEFERYLRLKALEPKVLVDYYREGFESRGKDGIRVTFDHNVRSTHSETLFPLSPQFYRIHHRQEVVLEIKYKHKPAIWLKRIVHRCGLRLVANSKYTQGVEAARHDRPYHNRIVIVR